ncbi:MAG: hypothetical protein AAFZ58_02875 [Pseudomonadota bacterium]
MTNKLSEADIYFALVNYARENEILIYTITGIYFAVALPLAGVAMGAGDYSETVQVFTATSGAVLSVLWFIVIERCRRWFTYILRESAAMERDSGFQNGRSTLYGRLERDDWFIRHTPRGSMILTVLYLMGIALFAALLGTKFLG